MNQLSINTELPRQSLKNKSEAKALRILLVVIFSGAWGWFASIQAEAVGRDFYPIVDTFFDLRRFDDFSVKLIYAARGNTVLIAAIDSIFQSIDPLSLTHGLYFFAAALRFFIIVSLLGARGGVPLVAAYAISLDLNQSRLSLALSFVILYIYLNRNWIFFTSAFFHLSLMPYILFKKFPFALILAGIVAFGTVGVPLLKNIAPRYFVVFDHTFPKNFFLYFILATSITFVMWRQGWEITFFRFGFALSFFIFLLWPLGFSPLYIGRIAEITLYLAVFSLGAYLKVETRRGIRSRYYGLLWAACTSVLFYQLITLHGNIYRFF